METFTHLGGMIVPFIIIVLAIGFLLTVKFAASRYRKVQPGRVGIFYGRDFKWQDGSTHGHLLLSSGGRVQRPIIESYIEIPTTAFQVTIDERDIPNKDNVRVTVKGVATCKISDDPAGLNNAVASILPMLTSDTIRRGGETLGLNEFVLNILKGHLRSIIGKLDIDGLLRQRDQFNQQMISESKQELQGLGIDLKNLVIQDINDTLGYIDALGKQTVAKAKAEAEIQVSNAEKTSATTIAGNQAAVAEAERNRDVQKAQFKTAADTERAKAEMAFEIAKAAQEQTLQVAQADRDAAAKSAQINVQQKEGERRTAELQATVVATAKADKEKQIIEAEASKQKRVLDAEAEAAVLQTTAEAKKNALTREGEGEAAKQRAILVAVAEGEAAKTKEALLAQATGTSALADAFEKMNEGGKLIVILDRLPILLEKGGDAGAKIMEAIFKSVAAPLGQIDSVNIVDLGGGNGVNGMDKLSKVVPNAVFGLLAQAKAQGLDISGFLQKIGIDPMKALEMLGGKPGKAEEDTPATPVAPAEKA